MRTFLGGEDILGCLYFVKGLFGSQYMVLGLGLELGFGQGKGCVCVFKYPWNIFKHCIHQLCFGVFYAWFEVLLHRK